MSDSLLSYFEQELRFIREEAAAFSERHPGTAEALGFSNQGIDDPQIARLVESVALLNGRLQQRLDDTFPELTSGLIGLLYPHYLRQIPSYSLLNVEIGDDAIAKHKLPKGTEFDLQSSGNSAIFRTTQDMTLYPLNIADLNVHFAPFSMEKPTGAEHAKAMIELTLAAVDEGMEIADFDIEHLDISLRGDSSFVLRLYDQLFHSASQLVVKNDQQSFCLGKKAIESLGFDSQHSVLPYSSVTFDGFKLLTEFFMFGERFNCFRVDLGKAKPVLKGSKVQLQIYLDELPVELARALNKNNFSLYSVPVVNLHQTTCEPIHIDFSRKQYPILIDASRPADFELFSVDKVLDIEQGKVTEVPQIYGNKYSQQSNGLFWSLKQSEKESGGLESSFQVADLDNRSLASDTRTWVADITCTNGSKAALLAINSKVVCRESLTIPGNITLARRPSSPICDFDEKKSAWVLLSHLQFNYQAILGAEDPAENLKHMFHLYNHSENAQNTAYIESIISIEKENVVAPIRISGKSCFAYGTRIEVVLDDSRLNGGIELFAAMLDHFFSYFCGFNSFTQLDICLQSKEGIYKRFPRRSGCKNLL